MADPGPASFSTRANALLRKNLTYQVNVYSFPLPKFPICTQTSIIYIYEFRIRVRTLKTCNASKYDLEIEIAI